MSSFGRWKFKPGLFGVIASQSNLFLPSSASTWRDPACQFDFWNGQELFIDVLYTSSERQRKETATTLLSTALLLHSFALQVVLTFCEEVFCAKGAKHASERAAALLIPEGSPKADPLWVTEPHSASPPLHWPSWRSHAAGPHHRMSMWWGQSLFLFLYKRENEDRIDIFLPILTF